MKRKGYSSYNDVVLAMMLEVPIIDLLHRHATAAAAIPQPQIRKLSSSDRSSARWLSRGDMLPTCWVGFQQRQGRSSRGLSELVLQDAIHVVITQEGG